MKADEAESGYLELSQEKCGANPTEYKVELQAQGEVLQWALTMNMFIIFNKN